MGDLKKKVEEKLDDLKDEAEQVLDEVMDLISPPRPRVATSTPFVGNVQYRGKSVFPDAAIFLNRDVALPDGDVTFMANGEKKWTTVSMWNAAVADKKFEIK